MLTIFGGIGLFLLGMSMLTNGLKEIAGEALKRWLNKFTRGTFSSMLSGILMTVLVQSSTATTLLTIGFVSAGLLTFVQSIGVIIGANIGSTSTGWIISLIGFKISLQAMALPIIGFGVFMSFIAPRDIKKFGGVLAGFGLLFLGIDMLQQGMGDAQNLIAFDKIPANSFFSVLLLIIIGIVMTIIMQASSAAMAATLAALFTGAIDFEQAAYLVIGQNIGTTATALFAAIGASVSAKRTAMTHLLFNVVTALLVTISFPYFLQLVKWLTEAIAGSFDETMALAIFHTLFSVLGAIIFMPFIKQFAKLLKKIVPERENVLTRNLDTKLLEVPSVALDVSFKTIRDIMAVLTTAQSALMATKKITADYERKIDEVEEAIKITHDYLNAIQSTSQRERNKHIAILHTQDHLVRLVKVLREQQQLEALVLQPQLMTEWQEILASVQQSLGSEEPLSAMAKTLEEHSQMMAQARRNKRNEYFERSVANETELGVAVSKVGALLWIDRLVYHYWRATARMAEFQQIDEEKRLKASAEKSNIA
ncbi:Na/Pi symporter [Metasolibacillus sp. FSL H7-0170]|uniref:Na/Pi cotransporter family protein n=1 Tax=Metasolibacillus TaxID=2703677 RepID=UPI0007980299|nr:Na/Pi symporter [Metasolibacillus fluoroglycofenilyticus]KYG92073.1 Na+/Picotransporter [[Bacillus] sp. KCTC 13219]